MTHIIDPALEYPPVLSSGINGVTVVNVNTKPVTFLLEYPKHWIAPVLPSPHAQEVEREFISWMKQVGIITSDTIEKYVRKFQPKNIAGNVLPMAKFEAALCYLKLEVMGTFWDDVVVEKAVKLDDRVLGPLKAIAGLYDEPGNPWITAFRQVGDELHRLGASKALLKRLSDKLVEWAHVTMDEEVLFPMEKLPLRSFEEAQRIRRITIGLHFMSVIHEWLVGLELPPEVLSSEVYFKIVDCAGQICGITNDLVSIGKDIAHNQWKSNIILFHCLTFKTTLQESCEVAVDLHNQAIQQFDELAAQLLKTLENTEWHGKVGNHLNSLRYYDAGHSINHVHAERYQQYVTYELGKQFVVKVVLL